MTITLEQTAEIHPTMHHGVYQIWLQKVTAHLNGQKMTRMLLNHHKEALMNDRVTALIGPNKEICELVVAEDTRSAMMNFQVTSAIHELFCQLLISWTSWPRPWLLQQAAAVNSSHQQQNVHLKHTSLCHRVWRSCSQPAASEGSTIKYLIQPHMLLPPNFSLFF